jgi:hypothetical protein
MLENIELNCNPLKQKKTEIYFGVNGNVLHTYKNNLIIITERKTIFFPTLQNDIGVHKIQARAMVPIMFLVQPVSQQI